MPVCPRCRDALLVQSGMPDLFYCSTCFRLGIRFRLVEEKICVNCGRYSELLPLLPNGLCQDCARKMANKEVK